MANTYYNIPVSATTMADIANALTAKYGAGVTIHYQTTTALIFSCAALSNKVIKITYASLTFYYGDAWTSGTTITNQVQFGGYATATTVTSIHLVLGTNTFYLLEEFSTLIRMVQVFIGKLSNDDYAVLATAGVNSYAGNHLGKNLTDNVDLVPVSFDLPFASGAGKIFKQPIILQRSDGGAEFNGDGTLASFRDIYNCSHTMTAISYLKSTNFIIGPSPQYMGSLVRFPTSILIEF